jgi:uncharacterized protein YbjT (DUF2867 family)
MQQEVEHLRPDGHDLPAQGQLPAFLVEQVVSKHELQDRFPLAECPRLPVRVDWRLVPDIDNTAARDWLHRPPQGMPGGQLFPWTKNQASPEGNSRVAQGLAGRAQALSTYIDGNGCSRESGENPMKIVVIGGTGLIGSKLVQNLRERGHDVLAAAPNTGVNSITREGLAQAMDGAQIVVDVANAPSWEDKAVLEFFETSSRNLLAAEAAAGVRHHVALSIVGSERLPDSGYFRAKVAQENLIKASGIPYTILRATQFFEFVGGIAQSATVGEEIRLSPALIQPMASDDVAATLADVTLETPVNGTIEVAGPEAVPLDELIRRFLRITQDTRKVVPDVHARYFGALLDDQSLTPGHNPRLGAIRFEDWLGQSTAQAGR